MKINVRFYLLIGLFIVVCLGLGFFAFSAHAKTILAIDIIEKGLMGLPNGEQVAIDAGLDQLTRSLEDTQSAMRLLLFFGTVSIVYFCWSILSVVHRPLLYLLRVLEKIDASECVTADIDMFRHDEFGKLSQMLGRFIRHTNALQDSLFESTDALQKTNRSFAENKKSVEEKIKNIGKLSRQSDESLVAALSQIKQLVHRIKATNELRARTEKAAHICDANVAQWGSVLDDVNGFGSKTASVLKTLDERIRAMGGLLRVMSKLSEQCELLSYNAAIESEKAGESGRGFSVVAKEVSEIAQGMKHSIGQMDVLLEEVHTTVTLGLRDGDEYQKNVRTKELAIRDAHDVFGDFISDVRALLPHMQSLSRALEKNTTKTDDLHCELNELTKISEDIQGDFQSIDVLFQDAQGALDKAVKKARRATPHG